VHPHRWDKKVVGGSIWRIWPCKTSIWLNSGYAYAYKYSDKWTKIGTLRKVFKFYTKKLHALLKCQQKTQGLDTFYWTTLYTIVYRPTIDVHQPASNVERSTVNTGSEMRTLTYVNCESNSCSQPHITSDRRKQSKTLDSQLMVSIQLEKKSNKELSYTGRTCDCCIILKSGIYTKAVWSWLMACFDQTQSADWLSDAS